MQINTRIRTPVGADLSCTPPIYRPFRRKFRCPHLIVNVHHHPLIQPQLKQPQDPLGIFQHCSLDFCSALHYNLTMFRQKSLAKTPVASPDLESSACQSPPQRAARSGRSWPVWLMLCTLAFLISILLTVTPLSRMPDTVVRLWIGWGAFLGEASKWLPANIGLTYQPSSASIEFFCIITLAFFFYCLGAWLVGRWPDDVPYWPV